MSDYNVAYHAMKKLPRREMFRLINKLNVNAEYPEYHNYVFDITVRVDEWESMESAWTYLNSIVQGIEKADFEDCVSVIAISEGKEI